jgi:diguanylate cyclase (GGDEF)-like protein
VPVSRLKTVGGRRQELAWLITVPVAVLTAALVVPMASETVLPGNWLAKAVLFLGLFIPAQATLLHFEVRRHSFILTLTETPLLLALFYLPPVLVIAVRVLSLVAVQSYQRFSLVKNCFNVAVVGLAITIASMIVSAYHPVGVERRTWLVLAAAVFAATLISLAGVIGVITLVQGLMPAQSLIKTTISVVMVAAVNITVGLVVLLVLNVEPWAILLLIGLGAVLLFVYRSYAKFVGQHRSLTELYELTRAMGDASRDGTLPDVLLGRVRELLQAEHATLWLPAQGRYPQTLLSARVDTPGLLDDSLTPSALRERALADTATIIVGPRVGDPKLRAVIREHGVKDAIVVPLRSGSAVIGSLEVTGRLGDLAQFGQSDVRLLETLAAQAAVAVENSRLVDRLRFDAYHDALTGLPNRRRLLALLDEAVKVRAPGEVVAVLLFDIDGLRDVNDTLGHDAGDRLVSEVAARLRRLAPAAALVGRAGSDEFAVTLRLPNTDRAVRLASELRTALQQPLEVETISLDVDVAVGVAVHPDHGTEPEILLKRADLAAQAAKLLATPVHLFHPSLQARSVHRLGLAADMRKALEAGDVEVYFQPKVSLPDRRIVGVECLARWEHATHGHVSPTDFVAVAEHTGQLGRLTDVVLRDGLRRARGWLDKGRTLPIAVNLSARTVLDPTFPLRVAALLDEYGVPASVLTLEITEDGMVGEPDRPMSTLRRLNDMGIRLAVDDFGTGYSSLSYLRRLPVHEVKIDRSFVQGMATDAGDLAIVRAVVDLARHFELVVVAEGVESELTVSLLEGLGCDVGQGFLFSRPLPFERFEAWLSAQTEPVHVDPTSALIYPPDERAVEMRRLRAVP